MAAGTVMSPESFGLDNVKMAVGFLKMKSINSDDQFQWSMLCTFTGGIMFGGKSLPASAAVAR